jgi:hypothetical protein
MDIELARTIFVVSFTRMILEQTIERVSARHHKDTASVTNGLTSLVELCDLSRDYLWTLADSPAGFKKTTKARRVCIVPRPRSESRIM